MTSAFTDKLYPDIANVLANENDGNDLGKAKITALKKIESFLHYEAKQKYRLTKQ